ncbi:ash family protein [Salmonella enterica subsp. enterica serovar Durban]|nr:ash family protein [Salmonella enterica subsp. enterica serovar Durban]EEL0575576.1 ash family protein [Salmonella enterica]EHF7707369.1 ash family protein [Salmonella enterica]EIN3205983.1 ash family protein [Salmonella enterica]EJS7203116.1 ash family protein [Salmonella enterica]
MTTYKNRLPQSALMGYISAAPHKTGAGFRSLLTVQAHNRVSGFFTCKASSRLFVHIMAGRTGEPQGSPGSWTAGTANLVRLATLSFAALDGELPLSVQGSSSWPTVNNAVPALTLSASTPRQKSIIACTVQKHWHGAYGLSPSAITALWRRCAFHPFSVIWLTIYATFTTCLTAKSATRNTPENLTQKQHSAFWWSVCLHDIQEAL